MMRPLAELLSDPGWIDTVAPCEIPGLIVQFASIQAQLAARAMALTADGRPREVGPPAEADLLNVEQAARRLGVAPSWLYRKAKGLPFTVRVGGRLRFDPRRLARYVADRAGTGG
jgi:hypothetical protein